MQIHVYQNLPVGQVDLGPVVAGGTAPAHGDTVDAHVDPVGVEPGGGGTDGAEDPAPVRVVAEERALDQVVAGDGAADLDRLVLGVGAGHLDRDVLGGALGVGEQLPGQVVAGGGHHPGQLLGRRLDSRRTAGQQQHGVVGGQTTIGVEPLEGDPAGGPQRLVEGGGVGHRVGRDHAQ